MRFAGTNEMFDYMKSIHQKVAFAKVMCACVVREHRKIRGYAFYRIIF